MSSIAPAEVHDLFSMREVVAAVRARWMSALLVAVVIATLCAIVVIRVTPLYRATVTLAPAIPDRATGAMGGQMGQLGGLASLIGIALPNNNNETEQALAVLESRQFSAAFIQKWKLLHTILPSFDAPATHADTPDATFGIPLRAIERFTKKYRRVIRDKKTGLVELQVDWVDPVMAATLANDMVRELNGDVRSRAITMANSSLKYLQAELQVTESIEIKQAINSIVESQEKQRMLATVNEDYAFRVIDPAVPADSDRPVWPPTAALVLLGCLIGVAVATAYAVVRNRQAPRPKRVR